jgi:hypothetical protein
MSSTEHFPRSLVDFETMAPNFETNTITKVTGPKTNGIQIGNIRDLKYGAREYDVEFSCSPRLSTDSCTFVHLSSPHTTRLSRTAFIDTELNEDFAKVVDDVSSERRNEVGVRLTSYVDDIITPMRYGIRVEGRIRRDSKGQTELHLTRKATITVPRSDNMTLITARHVIDFEDVSTMSK